MYSYGPLHMAEQKQYDQFEHTYSSYVRIRYVVLKTCQRRWTIGRSSKSVSGISVLAARHDDIYIYIYIFIYIYIYIYIYIWVYRARSPIKNIPVKQDYLLFFASHSKCCILMIIIIITIIIIIIQVDSRFWYERLYFFLHSSLSDTRREIQFIRAYATIYQPLRSGRIWHKVNF